jgi:hypothetical protein
MPKSRNQLVGTPEKDLLTGTSNKRFVYGRGGDDIITSREGVYHVWGEAGRDLYVTVDNAKGYMRIMDLEVGEAIGFCGCTATRIEQRGKDAWIVKGADVKAVVVGSNAADLELDFTSRLITLVADPLA